MTRWEATFSVAAFVAAIGSAFATWRLLEPAPSYSVDWQPLNEATKERLTGDEGVILLLVRMDYAVPWETLVAPFETKRFHTLMREHEIVPVLVDGSDWHGEEIAWVWERYVHSKYPRLILNVRGCETDTHFSGDDLDRLEDEAG